MNQLCISQVVYPRLEVINKDTVCLILIPQLRAANVLFVKLDECNEIKDSLKSQINKYEVATKASDRLIKSQKEELEILNGITVIDDKIISDKKAELKKSKRHISWLKTQRNVLAGVSFTLIAFTALHH